MKAITDELHATLLNVLGQLPNAQIEQVVVGLRSAVDIPKPIADDLIRGAQMKQAEELRAQLALLGNVTPPGKEPPRAEPPPNGGGEPDSEPATTN